MKVIKHLIKTFLYILILISQHIIGIPQQPSAPPGLPNRPIINNRILGGDKLNIKDAPYQVSLRIPSHSCGGILIAKHWVLTAGHCIIKPFPSSYKVYMGSSNNLRGGLEVSVTEIHRHPNYFQMDWDFALLKLENYDINNKIKVGFACLPQKDESVPDGTLLRVSGWGKTDNPSDDLSLLRAVYVEKINDNKCNKAYKGHVTERMMCAGSKQGGKDSCQGDSGGPLVWGNTVVGVVSWGYGCGEAKNPGVYSRIASVRHWIWQVAGV